MYGIITSSNECLPMNKKGGVAMKAIIVTELAAWNSRNEAGGSARTDSDKRRRRSDLCVRIRPDGIDLPST
jgi:hypothetical protein